MSITSIREAWLEAVKTGDAGRLASLVADDVVVVHGNSRCVRGRDELEADFKNGFERFAIGQRVTSVEVLIQGHWAIEIAEVESILTPVNGAAPTHVPSKAVVVLARQPNGSWKVARVLGLLDSPLRNATKALPNESRKTPSSSSTSTGGRETSGE
jgi:uncharacterized protein (TIGR02246 family)